MNTSFGRCRTAGFTLLEMLVVMSLLSLLMLGLASGMRGMAQTETRLDARIQSAEDTRIARGLVERALGRVSAVRWPGGGAPGLAPFQFEGSAQSLAWVGVMPARFGSGGRHYFRLAVEPKEDTSRLVLRFVPLAEQVTWPDWGQAASVELASGVTRFSLRYENQRLSEPRWLESWDLLTHLPSRVELQLEADQNTWPLWLVPLRLLPLHGGQERAVVGGNE